MNILDANNLLMEYALRSDQQILNGVVFASGRSITFACQYDLSDQSLESSVYGVKSEDFDFNGELRISKKFQKKNCLKQFFQKT